MLLWRIDTVVSGCRRQPVFNNDSRVFGEIADIVGDDDCAERSGVSSDKFIDRVGAAIAGGEADRPVCDRGGSVEWNHENILDEAFDIGVFAFGIRRYCYAELKFGVGNRGDDDVADGALLKPQSNFLWLVLHQVDADVGVEHVARH